MIRLLFVDDERTILLTLSAILKAKGFEVVTAATVPEALRLIGSQPFDCLLSDLNIGEPGDGFTVVSAMRRVQPTACTFILTGYPDFDSALQAIRNQVDDFFSKPADVDSLVDTLTDRVMHGRSARSSMPVRRVTEVLSDQSLTICERWLEEVEQHPDFAGMRISRVDRADHIRGVLAELILSVEHLGDDINAASVHAAQIHGRARYHQGYTIPQIVCESRLLQQAITETIEANVLRLDLSSLIHDMLRIGESLNRSLEASIRAYQAEIPSSLQTSFAGLYHSAHLGAALANEERVLDANDAFLRMIGFAREEMTEGAIRWQDSTPREQRLLDQAGIAQLLKYGVCVPFETEYLLRSGEKQALMVGAVRLSAEPFEWAAYVVDLSEHRRLFEAERRASELQAKSILVNQLAHEINNPLAAMTFTLHLLSTHPDATREMKQLLGDSIEMLDRIAGSVRAVLTVGS